MNRTIKLLMISDIFVMTGFGLTEPILAIYINDDIQRGTIFTAGLASALFLITKSLIQLPFARHVDSHDDADDRKWLIAGTFLIALVPFLYIFARHIAVVFAAEIIYGIGSGLAYPTWLGLWSTHIDKGKESFEWSLYSTMVGIGTAIAAGIGAAMAEFAGFTLTFVFVGIMAFIGCATLFELKRRSPRTALAEQNIHYHNKRKALHRKRSP